MCDTLKADVSALQRLSDATFSQMPADVSQALASASIEQQRLRLQLEDEHRNTQRLLEKERAAVHIQMEVRAVPVLFLCMADMHIQMELVQACVSLCLCFCLQASALLSARFKIRRHKLA